MGRCRISSGFKGAQGTKPAEQCVVIDVLRASSTMVTALSHGIREIRAVSAVAEALALRKQHYIVAGERQCLMVPGFDLGNSPVELLRAVRKRAIGKMALTTSNLTRVLAACRRAVICSSLNLTAVSKVMADADVNIVAVGGPHGMVEDLGVAMALLLKVKGVKVGNSLIRQMILQSPAAQHLISIGYSADVKFVCAIDRYDAVPVYEQGRVMKLSVLYQSI